MNNMTKLQQPLGSSPKVTASGTNKESQSGNLTFRVRGVPVNWGREQLETFLTNQENIQHVSIKSLFLEAGE